MTRENTPYECGLNRFCNSATAIGCIGRDALLRVIKNDVVKQVNPIEIAATRLLPCDRPLPIRAGARRVGTVASAAQSPEFGRGVGIGMVRVAQWDPGSEGMVETQSGVSTSRG